ncbi:Methyltransferase domain-containing protein [Methylomagnum ishizawai]|uniref:Methyltransferase domain-containing protein n=1 Tax=Methylomagnum ishizawai TaxID=1760988 RepID=A0A1Y6DAI2_9GAMM|nr:class I SAM-dependent methyltransferase [Methylomagnum ishizawai]SMF97342.1 Methyltransferase domain-containing protein [Methylomagnum ishizawai]
MDDTLNYALQSQRWHGTDAAYFERWHRLHGASLVRWVGRDKTAHILDIGCGFGLHIYSLLAQGYVNATGVDIDAAQIAVAQSHGLPCQRITPEQADAFYTERAGQINTVLMLDVLEHIPKSEQVGFLRRLHPIFKPGGRLIVRVPNALGPTALYHRYTDFTHHCCFTPESLEFVLGNAGFKAQRMMPDADLKLGKVWYKPWSLFRYILAGTSRLFWRAAYVADLGRPAFSLPLTRNIVAEARPAPPNPG